MDCNKACEEIFSHLFTQYLYKQVPSFMITLKENCLHQFGMIPKDNLSPEICKKLLTDIMLKGPTGQTEIHTMSIGNSILLVGGWSDFISCYSLKSSDVLVFIYEGSNIFQVNIFYQNSSDIKDPRGGGHSTVQGGLKDIKGKGKQIAEDEANSRLGFKRGRTEQKNSTFDIDSEKSRGSIEVRKQTPPEHMEILNQSGKKNFQHFNDSNMLHSRNSANAGDGQTGGQAVNKKDASVDICLACTSTEVGQKNKVSSSTWEESCSCGSVYGIETRSPLQKEVLSISSGSFHENGDEVKGQCSQNLQPKKELDNSDNSDSDQITTKKALKSRFVSGLIANKQTSCIANQLAARFRSQNPYFLKKIVKSNIRTRSRLNVLVKFGMENFPPKHSTVSLQLPQGSKSWSVGCRYHSKRSQWFFGKGWLAFTRENKIKVGDWCVFELTCKEKREMKVHIFRKDF